MEHLGEDFVSPWLPSLIVNTPVEGFDLALKLSRMAVKELQPSVEIRRRLSAVYEDDAAALIAESQVVALFFTTVAAANGYWKRK
jgi:Hexameric tyrosine-coordinated heme protein (HTHP)